MNRQTVTVPRPLLPMDPFLNQHRPWVSVICTCYNQADYVVASLQSVVGQRYANVELVVIDNASCLHGGVGGGRSDEPKAQGFELAG